MTSNSLFSVDSIKRAIARTPVPQRFRHSRKQQSTGVKFETIQTDDSFIVPAIIDRTEALSYQRNHVAVSGRKASHSAADDSETLSPKTLPFQTEWETNEDSNSHFREQKKVLIEQEVRRILPLDASEISMTQLDIEELQLEGIKLNPRYAVSGNDRLLPSLICDRQPRHSEPATKKRRLGDGGRLGNEKRASAPVSSSAFQFSRGIPSASNKRKKSIPSKAAQKSNSKRYLPVPELQAVVCTSESLSELGASPAGRGLESPEDLLSGYPNYNRPLPLTQPKDSRSRKNFYAKMQISLGFGSVDMSQFMRPDRREISPGARYSSVQSYCDGFVGMELLPTRRVIPTRRLCQWGIQSQRIPLRRRELTIVSDKTNGFEVQEELKRKSNLRVELPVLVTKNGSPNEAEEFGSMSFSPKHNLRRTREDVLQSNEPRAYVSHHAVSKAVAPTPNYGTKLNLHKKLMQCKVIFTEPAKAADEGFQKSLARPPTPQKPRARSTASNLPETPRRQTSQVELEICQQLMMVSASRRSLSGSPKGTPDETWNASYCSHEDSEDEDCAENYETESNFNSESEGSDENEGELCPELNSKILDARAGSDASAIFEDANSTSYNKDNGYHTASGYYSEPIVPIALKKIYALQRKSRRGSRSSTQSAKEHRHAFLDGLSQSIRPSHMFSQVNKECAYISQDLEAGSPFSFQMKHSTWGSRRPAFETTLIEANAAITKSPSPSLKGHRTWRLEGVPRMPTKFDSQATSVADSHPSQAAFAVEKKKYSQESTQLGDSQLLFQSVEDEIDSCCEELRVHRSQLNYCSSSCCAESTLPDSDNPATLSDVRRAQSVPVTIPHATAQHVANIQRETSTKERPLRKLLAKT